MLQQNLPFECVNCDGVVYICQELIGNGSQGLVYKGIRKDQPQINLAIKLSDNTRDDELIFLRKLQSTSNQFKHIIKYYDVIDNKQKNSDLQINQQLQKDCFIMELGSANLLEEVIQKQDKYTEIQKMDIIYQIALGIQELHNFKHVHRDIKPENIIKVGDIWKLCDFGFLKHQISQNRTSLVGTPYYIAPEINKQDSDILNKDYNKVDIWSFGCIIFEILTGNLFFSGNSIEEVIQEIENYSQFQRLNPKQQNTDERFKYILNHQLQILCKCMITVDRKERYDIHQVVEELNKIRMPSNNTNITLQKPQFQQRATIQINNFGGPIKMLPNQQSEIPFLTAQPPTNTIPNQQPFLTGQPPINTIPGQPPINTIPGQQPFVTGQPSTNTIPGQQPFVTGQPPINTIPGQPLTNTMEFKIFNQNPQILQNINKQQLSSQTLQNNNKQQQINPIQNQQILQNNKLQFSNLKNPAIQQFPIPNQQQIFNIPKQNLQDNFNIPTLQKTDLTQNFTQNTLLKNQNQNLEQIHNFLDQLIKPEKKSELMKYFSTQDNTVINQDNLPQLLMKYIYDRVDSNIKLNIDTK